MLLAHATGFHAHVWLPIAERLTGAGFHCIAFDSRAHGDSGRPDDGDYDWDRFSLDVLAVVDAAGWTGVRPLAAGHSCGSVALLRAEMRSPGTFRSMYLWEPVIPPVDPPPGPSPENPLAGGARRRRAVFPSRDAAYDNFASKPPFNRLAPDALRAYVDFGFSDTPDGDVELKCRGEDEAEVYVNGSAHDTFRRLPEVTCPVTIACGADSEAFGPEAIDAMAARLPHARTEPVPGLTHFGPLEDPPLVADRIAAAFSLLAGG